MRCYVWLQEGRAREAVGLCPHCLIGLCARYLLDRFRDPGRGGMRPTCDHRIVPVDQAAVAHGQASVRP